MPDTLDPAQLQSALESLPDWSLEHGELVQTTTFRDFAQAMEFVNKVASLAEKAGHHPDIDIRYNRVRLALVTHDASGITFKDLHLASSISLLRKPAQHT